MAVTTGRSAKNYQERKGHRATLLGPGPIWSAERNAARKRALIEPLPLPELQHEVSGQDPPDGPRTNVWPHGTT